MVHMIRLLFMNWTRKQLTPKTCHQKCQKSKQTNNNKTHIY